MSRTFIIADIHGAHEALLQVFQRSGFRYKKDRLICLGDICDRRTGVKACVDELLRVKKLILILGNHDYWTLKWMHEMRMKGLKKTVSSTFLKGEVGSWINQGGRETLESYADGVDESHYHFFSGAKYYHIEDNRLFVHGGIRPGVPINMQDQKTFIWDRELVESAVISKDVNKRLTGYDAVYVGHTPTLRLSLNEKENYGVPTYYSDELGSAELCNPRPAEKHSRDKKKKSGKGKKETSRWNDFPVRRCEVYLMDTGAGWSDGRLSMMDMETCEVWQSDPLP